MTDLTKRLRALSRHEHDDLSIGEEAADEIERLQSSLARHVDSVCALTTERDALRARIERSSKHVAEWTASHGLTFFDAPTDLDGKRVALVVIE
jgi:hypothetical protein